jgi:hypothetical protein
MSKRHWFASIAIVLMTAASSMGCGAAPEGTTDHAGEAQETKGETTAQTAQALTSGNNIGDCRKIKSNPCASYGLCGWNWCNYDLSTIATTTTGSGSGGGSQAIWCGTCPW